MNPEQQTPQQNPVNSPVNPTGPGPEPLPPQQPYYQPPAAAAPQQSFAAQEIQSKQAQGPLGQYDFIMNPQKAHKPSILAGGSVLQRVGIFGGGIIILIIIAAIVSSAIKGGSSSNFSTLTPVLQEQTELVRVAAAGAKSATSQGAQELASNVQLSVSSARSQLLTYLADNHQKISPKLLILKHSAAVDTQLANALANNAYDSSLTSIIQNDLASYQLALKKAYTANSGPKGRKLLNAQYMGAQLLIQQSK